MRFLVDAQLPPALARQIETLGHSADHVFDWGLSNCEARRASGALHGVLSEPAAAGRLLRIHVERFNPALRL